ncbi:MAG: protein kinase [Deltaproteobacteria bacterium]|nr:protein kinase [Deltaproteobacteria bacterium]
MSSADKERMKALEAARALEQRGQFDTAVKVYMQLGATQEAARVLASNGKYGEAGNLLLTGLGVSVGEIHRLEGDPRRQAYLAASYFSKAGDVPTAVDILVELGERARAAELLERGGDHLAAERLRSRKGGMYVPAGDSAQRRAVGGAAVNLEAARKLEKEGKLDLAVQTYVQIKHYAEAGRILGKLRRFAEAANMFAEGGLPYEAGLCYLEAGDTGKGLDNLVRVPRNDRRYREAADKVVRVAATLKLLDFQIEHFLTKYISMGPSGEGDLETFYILSRLYEQHDLVENAKEALKKILEVKPGYRDAAALVARYEAETKVGAAVYEKIRDEDAGFRGERRVGAQQGRPKMPGLPALPELPDLPPMPQIAGLSGYPPPPQAGYSAAVAGTIYSAGAPPSPITGVSPPQPAAAVPPSDPEVGFAQGTVVAGRYELKTKLGQGGMAMVFKAWDIELEEDIALKVFMQPIPDAKAQAETQKRFKQELKLSRQLSHPNIIRLYDIGVHAGYRYISMELLVGHSLQDLIENGPMEFGRGLGYMVQACAGLQAAHDQGVIHRDIKPENLFVTNEDAVKVMDFGIAKNAFGPGLTIAGQVAGTPEYMAPEQITNFSTVTAAADLYSLGLVMYRTFAGALPFQHDELMPLLMMHVNQIPRSPRELNPAIPEDLEAVILKLLEKDPTRRFANCRELARAIQQIRLRFRRDGGS